MVLPPWVHGSIRARSGRRLPALRPTKFWKVARVCETYPVELPFHLVAVGRPPERRGRLRSPDSSIPSV